MRRNEIYKQVMAWPAAERQRMFDKLRASFSKDIPSQLTTAERKELLRKAAAFRKNSKSVELSPAEQEELQQRLKAARRDPGRLLSWTQAKLLLQEDRKKVRG